jgi:hypothetical protein
MVNFSQLHRVDRMRIVELVTTRNRRVGAVAQRGVSRLTTRHGARRRYRGRPQTIAGRDPERIGRPQKARAEAAPGIPEARPEEPDEQLRKLRAAGTVAPAAAPPTTAAATPSKPAATEVAQTSAPSPAQPAPERNPPPAAAAPAGESAPITGPSAEEQQARQVVETAPTLSSVGAVLTPEGSDRHRSVY